MRYESEMIAPIKARMAKMGKNSVVVEELGVGYGVADIVVARPRPVPKLGPCEIDHKSAA